MPHTPPNCSRPTWSGHRSSWRWCNYHLWTSVGLRCGEALVVVLSPPKKTKTFHLESTNQPTNQSASASGGPNLDVWNSGVHRGELRSHSSVAWIIGILWGILKLILTINKLLLNKDHSIVGGFSNYVQPLFLILTITRQKQLNIQQLPIKAKTPCSLTCSPRKHVQQVGLATERSKASTLSTIKDHGAIHLAQRFTGVFHWQLGKVASIRQMFISNLLGHLYRHRTIIYIYIQRWYAPKQMSNS